MTKSSTSNLTLCSKCQIDGEDFVKFCGLLRKHELYYVLGLALQKIFPGKDKNDTDIIVRISQDWSTEKFLTNATSLYNGPIYQILSKNHKCLWFKFEADAEKRILNTIVFHYCVCYLLFCTTKRYKVTDLEGKHF